MAMPNTLGALSRADIIRSIVDQAPPLSPEQRDRIGFLLAPVAVPVKGR